MGAGDTGRGGEKYAPRRPQRRSRGGRRGDSRRAVEMGLCTPDSTGGNLLYSFGRGDQYWDDCFSSTTTDGDRAKWVQEILAEAAKNRAPGAAAILKAMSEAHAASIVARAAHGASLHEAMYARLRVISRNAPTYAQDMTTWFLGCAP